MAEQSWAERNGYGDHCCTCPCHVHPGTYPTTQERPCKICGHVHDQGTWMGTLYQGHWEKRTNS